MVFRCAFSEDHFRDAPSYRRNTREIPTSIECKAISALTAILDRVSERKGDLNAQLDWVKEQFPFEPVVYGSTYISGPNRYANARRARDTLHEVMTARGLIDQLKVYLDFQCETIKEKADALTLRTGLESLPDNIVSDILEFATRPEGGEYDFAKELQATRDAHGLSHVCQRFRILMLNNALNWSTLFESMKDIRQVEFCLKFSKQAPVDVCLDRFGWRQQKDNFEHFFKTCLLSSGRWRCLTLGDPEFESGKGWNRSQNWPEISRNIASIDRLGGEMDLPGLEQLYIHFDMISLPEDLDSKFFPFWGWTMPNLVELELSGFNPPPPNSSFSQSLESFTFTCGTYGGVKLGRDYDMAHLVDFISSCSALWFVGLHVQQLDDSNISKCPLKSVASVEEVEFSFRSCHPAVAIALCESIHFPNVSTMTFGIVSLYVTNYGKEERSITQTLLQECFSRHPHITSLRFTFKPLWSAKTPIVLPITCMSGLEEMALTFNCWKDLLFWGESEDLESSILEDLHLPPIRKLQCLTRSIENDWSYIQDWVKKFLSQLKHQGDLDTFKKLAVIQTTGKPDTSEGFENVFCDYISSFVMGWVV